MTPRRIRSGTPSRNWDGPRSRLNPSSPLFLVVPLHETYGRVRGPPRLPSVRIRLSVCGCTFRRSIESSTGVRLSSRVRSKRWIRIRISYEDRTCVLGPRGRSTRFDLPHTGFSTPKTERPLQNVTHRQNVTPWVGRERRKTVVFRHPHSRRNSFRTLDPPRVTVDDGPRVAPEKIRRFHQGKERLCNGVTGPLKGD